MTISAAGMQNIAYQQARNAADIVSATTTDVGSPQSDGKLEKAIVAQTSGTSDFKANASAFNTANKMTGALLDVIA